MGFLCYGNILTQNFALLYSFICLFFHQLIGFQSRTLFRNDHLAIGRVFVVLNGCGSPILLHGRARYMGNKKQPHITLELDVDDTCLSLEVIRNTCPLLSLDMAFSLYRVDVKISDHIHLTNYYIEVMASRRKN